MNIVLFEADEIKCPLLRTDARANHILKVLRRAVGDDLDVGLIDGPKGKATVVEIHSASLELSFVWGEESPPLYPIDLIVGLSRPQTNRKILQEAAALGVRSMRFVTTERGEPSYAKSKLWSTGEWRRHVLEGVAQAFATGLPQVSFGMSLGEAIEAIGTGCRTCLALDNYESSQRLGSIEFKGGELATALAIGAERGWTGQERILLTENGYVLVGLGERVLRTETAVVSSVAIVREKMG